MTAQSLRKQDELCQCARILNDRPVCGVVTMTQTRMVVHQVATLLQEAQEGEISTWRHFPWDVEDASHVQQEI